MSDPGQRPPHHGPDGKYRIPWPLEDGGKRGTRDMLRWMWERFRHGTPPNPPPGSFPLATPDPARPRAAPGETRITWVGHSTFLVQAGGVTVLTDPVWSRRASPSQRIGPARFAPPGLPFDALPPVDAVLLSHDHYDHLDEPTVRRLGERFGPGLAWVTPLGYRAWMAERGVENVVELDWWEETEVRGEGSAARVVCLPAQHWTRRSMREYNDRLWASYALLPADAPSVYFGADTGYFPGFREIGERLGPFAAALLPIGAYEPRWFMKVAHMNPEEAVRTYLDLGGTGEFVPMHWGTFRLTDEDPLEPPVRVRRAWADAGLPPERLRVLRHGETLRLDASTKLTTG